jgi:hypothetical protein
MQGKPFHISVFALFTIMLILISTSCGERSGFDAKNLNDAELLTTVDVVVLLNENGINLTKATDFPIDLSSCIISEKAPQSFVSGETGIYYLFYVFDGYNETSDLKSPSAFIDFSGPSKEFSDSLIPAGIVGKNLCLCQWDPKFGAWRQDRGTADQDLFDTIMEEKTQITDILWAKAFGKKTAAYLGQSESWEVKIPVKYINNVRTNESGVPEILFLSEGETHVKYLNSDEKTPVVTAMRWLMTGRESSITYEAGEGSILSEKVENGFYRAVRGLGGCNPEQIKSITVTITSANGDTEEIICMLQ